MSAHDRRASYMNAPRPRVVSNRVDVDRPSRGAASPLHADNMDPLRTSTSSQRHRMSRDQKSMSEKRTERTVITTKEKAARRNPVKEPVGATNRGEREKSRSKQPGQVDDASSDPRRKEHEAAEGQ